MYFYLPCIPSFLSFWCRLLLPLFLLFAILLYTFFCYNIYFLLIAMAPAYQTPSTMESLRAYVMQDTQSNNRDPSTVLLTITHSNLQAQFPELRFNLYSTVAEVKQRLYRSTGTLVDNMRVVLRQSSSSTRVLARLDQDDEMLGFYGPHDYNCLHVIDTDPNSLSAAGWLEDVSLVDKYVMSDQAYDQRQDTYRKFKQEQLAKDPNWRPQGITTTCNAASTSFSLVKEEDLTQFQTLAAQIKVGDRCQVQPGNRRATVVCVVTETSVLPEGAWIGVEYDEPVGKNDGMVKGHRFFTCKKNFGGLVRPTMITVGDFAKQLDEDLEEELSEDEL